MSLAFGWEKQQIRSVFFGTNSDENILQIVEFCFLGRGRTAGNTKDGKNK